MASRADRTAKARLCALEQQLDRACAHRVPIPQPHIGVVGGIA